MDYDFSLTLLHLLSRYFCVAAGVGATGGAAGGGGGLSSIFLFLSSAFFFFFFFFFFSFCLRAKCPRRMAWSLTAASFSLFFCSSVKAKAKVSFFLPSSTLSTIWMEICGAA